MYKNLKLIVLTLTLTLWGYSSFSQEYKNADKLLEDVINKISGYKNFKADLSYTMVNNEMDINEKKTGKIFVSGDKYRIEMPGQIIITDGKTLWTYLEDSQEVMVSSVEDNGESISPTKILTSYNKDYSAKFSSDPKYKKGVLRLINLKPGDKGKNFDKMSVVINEKKLDLESFSVYDKNGNVFTYNILNIQPNVNLPEDTFVFDPKKHPDVEVVDMR
jgi:outer membrane lipoprotein-sorting protein